MLIAEINKVKKHYGDRLLLDIDDFKVYENDRIGIVGLNGCGKTTLLNILSGRVTPDEGICGIYGPYAYISQLEEEKCNTDEFVIKKFGVVNPSSESLSGGEITRLKIAKALSKGNVLIIADEPTSNLDSDGIEDLQKELKTFKGALLIVSHDREFLDQMCTSILEIENGRIQLYSGNYSKYRQLKKEERERSIFEYEQYISEKQRLEEALAEKQNSAKSVRKTPPRMGNSEARLHKMGNQKAKASLERAAKSIQSRIDNLEVRKKPQRSPKISVDMQNTGKLHSKILFSSDCLSKNFGDRIIFNNTNFKIYNGSKTAVIGTNGSGKTTLLNMIINNDEAINTAYGIKIGYFSQDMSILSDDKTLLQNVMEGSIYDETFVRILLSRLYFKSEDLLKNTEFLSGGEKVKTALAKIIVSDFNVLILDEPTNYLDVYSMEAVEEALSEYTGTVIFVSHDKRFVRNIADHIISIEDKKLVSFEGTLEEYYAKKEAIDLKISIQNTKMVLENRLAEVLSKLSMPSKSDDVAALDREYKELLLRLRQI